MDGNEKTQPQELLEEVIGITHQNQPEFPTLEEQAEYWRQKDAEESDKTPFTCTHNNPDGTVCDRTFKSAQAVRMHVARVHDKTILAPNEGQPKGKTLVQVFAEEGRPVESLDTHRRKWSLARRRAFNKMKRAKMLSVSTGPLPSPWIETPVEVADQEPVAMIKHCPFCGESIERFLT
jgi:hypothetical protein